ncbi:SH3 domain-containing protein [Pyricularia oryzae]|nr:SH3 domain-containing protein [Pyricularia oryzae]KAI7927262.1 SH3 domain-containing protein [Pyricularia oryzae]
MMAVLSQSGSSPATSPAPISPSPTSSPTSNSNHPPLPPLITSPPSSAVAVAPPGRRTTLPRPMSYSARNRLSQYSTGSVPSRSRPPSHIFPIWPSSLPYTLVRDFAYPPVNPLHYGPPPEPSLPPSGMTTPASEHQRRLSDPPASWVSRENGTWSEGFGKGGDLAPMHLGDGPPWSEDEDLQSPVVSSRHRKHHGHGRGKGGSRGGGAAGTGLLDPTTYDRERGYYMGTSGDGSERYYVNQGGEANGPGGEYVTYPPDQARNSAQGVYNVGDQQPRQYAEHDAGYRYGSDGSSSSPSSPDLRGEDQSRYSRDYQFTITSPDEEMHGKAVALFDFARENENELPLLEGQIIWVSYRHGQGWLVAMDPKTQESGLVPEEYVRLLRDIEGGMTSLTAATEEGAAPPATTTGTGTGSPNDAGTPTQTEHKPQQRNSFGHTPSASTSSTSANGYHQPIVSTFSTSSKDLDPYPQHLLGTQAGQTPPQVVHYHGQRGGSQANTPTLSFHHDVGIIRRGSIDHTSGKRVDTSGERLPGARMGDSLAEQKEESSEERRDRKSR